MVTSNQIQEKIRDYRRSIKHSWTLFKASRIGLVGLGIMVAFIVMALVSPYMGLRHPMDWWAPDEDIVEIEGFFNDLDGMNTKGIFDHSFAYRLRPVGSMNIGDRLYVGGGDGGTFSPYGIYTYGTETGNREWTSSAFETNSRVSSDIVVNNFGGDTDPDDAEVRILFGCENGRFYILKDEFDTTRSAFPPDGNFRYVTQLDGSVTGIAIYQNGSYNFNFNDLIFVTTDAGTIYGFRGPIGHPVTPLQMWSTNLNNNSALKSPIVSENGEYVFVGSQDGKLYGLSVNSGLLLPSWGSEYTVSPPDDIWSSNPVTVGNPPVIYATNSTGFLHSIWGSNGTPRSGWETPLEVRNARNEVDGGVLTSPVVLADGSTIMLCSDTGNYYSIGADKDLKLDFDTRISATLETECIVPPYYDSLYSRQIFVTANCLNGTASDSSDDFTILYCLDNRVNVTWRKTFEGMVLGAPVSYSPPRIHLTSADVAIATVNVDTDGTPSGGRMYSFSATGRNLCPLPPTWTLSEEEKPESGNSYILGTDDRGHDILSQTLLGSRIALLVGFLSAIFSIGIGVIMGLVSGYYGGNVDAVLMRFTDVILVLPALPLLIVFAAMMTASIWNIVLIIAILGWGGVARVIRSEVLSLKERPFIDSARVTGASKSRIMFRHIAPNVLPLALLYMTFAVSGAILFEAALSFIGLGDPSTMTWGMMLNYVQHSNALEAWWWLLPPGICITLVCLAFFLLGRAFDEIVNPRLRRR